jgi:hypothetical protein
MDDLLHSLGSRHKKDWNTRGCWEHSVAYKKLMNGTENESEDKNGPKVIQNCMEENKFKNIRFFDF